MSPLEANPQLLEHPILTGCKRSCKSHLKTSLTRMQCAKAFYIQSPRGEGEGRILNSETIRDTSRCIIDAKGNRRIGLCGGCSTRMARAAD